MLYLDYTNILLNTQGVKVRKIEKTENNMYFHLSSIQTHPICPICGKPMNIHDYRTNTIKHGKFNSFNIFLLLKKRRFKCKGCNKIITEKFNFYTNRFRIHSDVFWHVIEALKENVSFSHVAKEHNLSLSTVIRYFDKIPDKKLFSLPNVIAIDEFKGNTGGFKYNAILTNPQTKEVLDIMECREKCYLINYFEQFKKKDHVEIFIQDMWKPFKDTCKSSFKNATIIADKYHYSRQVQWAVENVRKNIQKNLSQSDRIFFKNCKRLLYTPKQKLTQDEKISLYTMFSISYDLQVAYDLKEQFKEFSMSYDKEEAKKILEIWIEMAKESNLKEFKDAIKAFTNWKQEILNSKTTNLTNAYTEGTNNKIKVLKRNGYGYQNFNRFRKRILHLSA